MGGGSLRSAATGTPVLAVALVAVLALAATACSSDDQARPSRATTSSSTSTTTTGDPTTSPSTVPTTAPPTTPTTAPPTTAAPTTVAPAGSGVHRYPVLPAAATSYARSHHDYPAADVFARCGSEVVAVTDGVVQELSRTDSWNPKVNSGDTRGGLFVSLVGDDGVRYYGSHLREVDASIAAGTRVRAGQRLGAVGETGDARGVGCHLHFGISSPCGPGDWQRRRGQVWPQKYLDAWRTGGSASPAAEIAAQRC